MVKFNEVATRYLGRKTTHDNDLGPPAVSVITRLTETFGDLDLEEFSPLKKGKGKFLITCLKEDLVKEGKANATVNAYFRYLKAILYYARDDLELLSGVPVMKMLKENKREIFLTPDEVKRLISHLDPVRAAMVEFAVNTGQRNGNVRNLRWSQIEPDLSAFTLEGEETKNGKRIIIALNSGAKKVLASRQRHPRSDFVFCKQDGKPFSASGLVNKTWHKALKAANLPRGVVFHTLRHTFASWHLRSGTTAAVLQKLGGWESITSMERYAHLDTKGLAQASQNIEGMMV